MNNYLSLKRRGLTQKKIFIYYPLKRGGAYPQFFGKQGRRKKEEGRSRKAEE
ncbi:MAG: hypothetical protein F6K48_28040 [Okeania sp. SIO3H1]|nr:hypothetical protein [Okeania sp. SIO3H1]